MLGLNLLIRLGRSVLKGPVTDAGLLPAQVYRHLVLEALEAEDFPEALNYLKWAEDPLLAQLLVLRLRLLAEQHRRQRRTLEDLVDQGVPAAQQKTFLDLLSQEDRALHLLAAYEAQALNLAATKPGTTA